VPGDGAPDGRCTIAGYDAGTRGVAVL
jgi:hypothetical protein